MDFSACCLPHFLISLLLAQLSLQCKSIKKSSFFIKDLLFYISLYQADVFSSDPTIGLQFIPFHEILRHFCIERASLFWLFVFFFFLLAYDKLAEFRNMTLRPCRRCGYYWWCWYSRARCIITNKPVMSHLGTGGNDLTTWQATFISFVICTCSWKITETSYVSFICHICDAQYVSVLILSLDVMCS